MRRISLSLALISTLSFAGTVDTKFDYQEYLDFGANKGKYKAGNSVTITSKDGSSSIYIEKMPDFSGANLTGNWRGEFTNIGGSYALSAGHMSTTRGDYLQFGGARSVVIAQSLNFQNWYDTSNRDPNTNAPLNRDFAVFRMDKLNLNQPVKLIQTNFFKKDASALQGYAYLKNLSSIINNPRYTMYAGAGTGTQGISRGNQRISVANAGFYFTGGIGTNVYDYSDRFIDGLIATRATKEGSSEFENFARNIGMGDSGSAFYVYDNVDKQWYMIGLTSTSPGYGAGSNSVDWNTGGYTLVNHLAIHEFIDPRTIVFNSTNNVIRDGNVYAGSVLMDETTKATSYDARVKSMETDKDYFFKRNGSLMLKENADLGSTVLYVDDGLKFSVVGGHYLTIGGIVVGENSKVIYSVKTKEKDALVKMGDGILNVTQSSPTGKLRVGQGTVELKSADGIAFGSVYAINGATISLKADNQINTNYLYFGMNGANLELNGYSLAFGSDIKASDYGANILNSSDTKSTITLSGGAEGIYHGQFNGNIDLDVQRDYVFDGSMNIKNLNVKGNVVFQAHPVIHNYVPEDSYYKNKDSGLDPVKTVDALSGETFQTTPTTEKEIESREFVFESITLKDSTLSQSSYTRVTADLISADNSVLTIGNGKIYLDKFDGENVKSTPCGAYGNNYECLQYDDYTLEFQYDSYLTQKDLENQEIYLIGDINLKNNSSATFNQAFYQGHINGDDTSKANFERSVVKGSVNVNQFSANGSHFLLEVDNSSDRLISASQKAYGGKNYVYILPKEEITKKILLISLKNSENVGSKMFLPKSYSTNFSVFKPAFEYKKVGEMDNWYLNNLTISENTETTNQANQAIGQISAGYVLEWNNLFKRMGELRDEPSVAGLWVKVFGGQATFDSSYKTGFAEIQIGADKHNTYEDFELFAGGLLGATYYNLSDTLSGKMSGLSVGAYTSFIFKNGFFVDLIAKYLHYKNDFSLTLDGQSQSLDTNEGHFAIMASAEVGYRAEVNENFYIEPQIEFISGYLGEQTLKNSEVSLIAKGTVPLNFKTSVSAGYKNKDFNIRAGLGAQLDLLNSGKSEIRDLYQTHTFDGFRDTRMFVNVGGTYNFTDMNRLSFEVEHSFLGRFNVDYLLNVTYRHGF